MASREDNKRLRGGAIRGNTERVRKAIYRGADVQCEGQAGNRPLHSAVQFQHLHAVRLLVEAGANVNQRNNSGKKPIDYARELVRSRGAAPSRRVRLCTVYGVRVAPGVCIS